MSSLCRHRVLVLPRLGVNHVIQQPTRIDPVDKGAMPSIPSTMHGLHTMDKNCWDSYHPSIPEKMLGLRVSLFKLLLGTENPFLDILPSQSQALQDGFQ